MSAPGATMAAEMAQQPERLTALLARRAPLVAELRAAVGGTRPRGVTLLSRGSSDNAALYGRYVLGLVLRCPVSLAAPSLWTRYDRREDLRGHVAIALSQSGRTPEIADVLGRMRDVGAATVAITNDPGSPLARSAQASVDLCAGDEVAVPATKTVSLQMAAMAFAAEALGRPPWGARDWAAIPAAQAAALRDADPVAEAAAIVARSGWSLHVARGPLLAVALEGALKLAETAGLPAIGYASSDFLHGPIAMAGPRACVVGYAREGPVASDVRDAVAAAGRAGATTIGVGDIPGAEVTLPGPVIEPLAPLVAVIRAQQLAALTTLALGRDPDRPPQLSKVTATT